MSRTTLNPGDLVVWASEGDAGDGVLLVAENGEDLWFQFSPKPWKYSVSEVEQFLNGQPFPEEGHLYKSYDEASGRSYADPELDSE